MHDESPTPDRARSRTWFRRHPGHEGDSVRIDAEESHSWWAARDEVSAPAVARRRADERAQPEPPAVAAAARAFAPARADDPDDEIEPDTTRAGSTAERPRPVGWDTASLFQWAAGTEEADPAAEPLHDISTG